MLTRLKLLTGSRGVGVAVPDFFGASTAGHCFGTEDTELIYEEGEGPPVYLGFSPDGQTLGPRIGTAVYAVQWLPGFGIFDQLPGAAPKYLPGVPEWMDFALIRLDKNVAYDPSMCLFGGPTGINEDLATLPIGIHMYGTGIASGYEPITNTSTLPGRSSFGVPAEPTVMQEVMPTAPGDPGSPIIDDAGRAVATQTGNYAPRLAPALERVREVLALHLELLTGPLGEPVTEGRDPDCHPVPPASDSRVPSGSTGRGGARRTAIPQKRFACFLAGSPRARSHDQWSGSSGPHRH